MSVKQIYKRTHVINGLNNIRKGDQMTEHPSAANNAPSRADYDTVIIKASKLWT